MKRWMLWLVCAVLALGLAVGVVRALSARKAQQQALADSLQRPAPVMALLPGDVLALQPVALQLGVPISGALVALESSVVKARVAGELQGLQLREGDTVRAGQEIARIDATDAEARFRQARLQADAAEAQVTIQQRQLSNNQALVREGFISETALTASEANLRGAQASYAAARAAQDSARKMLEDTVLRSPMNGQIAQRWANNGERMAVDARVVEVVQLGALELQALLPAQDSLRVRVGQSAWLQAEGSALRLPAQVVRINPSAQAGSRAVPAYLRLQQQPKDDRAPLLRPGLYVSGQILLGEIQALALPLDAVRSDQPRPYVQVVEQDQVRHVPVQLGERGQPARPDDTGAAPQDWVVVQGLPAGAQVLSARVGALQAGTRVQMPGNAAPTQAP